MSPTPIPTPSPTYPLPIPRFPVDKFIDCVNVNSVLVVLVTKERTGLPHIVADALDIMYIYIFISKHSEWSFWSSVSLRSIIMTTSLDHSVSYLLFHPPPPPPVLLLLFLFCLLVGFLLSFWSFVGFVASDVLTTVCHLAIVNVSMIIILSIGNTQISILLLCFLYLFVELMITMNE